MSITISDLVNVYFERFPAYDDMLGVLGEFEEAHQNLDEFPADSVCGEHARIILSKTRDLLSEIEPTWGDHPNGARISKELIQAAIRAAIQTILLHLYG